MSYNLPNQLTKPKGRNLTLHRVLGWWPLLVWIAALFVAQWAYKQGVVFKRLNGAVDVYQENVSPLEDGSFDKLADGIVRGKAVKAGEPVAYMQNTILAEKLSILSQEIETRRTERLRQFDQDLLKIDSDLRKIEDDRVTSQAEKQACEDEIAVITSRAMEMAKGNKAVVDNIVSQMAAEYKIKLAKSSALAGQSVLDKEAVAKDRAKLQAERDTLAKETDIKKYAERNQAAQLAQLEHRVERLTLKANRDGIVDLIMKESGEFVKQGEGVLKIVGKATQIVGFLAQDQLGQIAVGKKVWITSTKDRRQVFESKVQFLAPRMNSVRDVSSTAASRLFGRDVICEYPSTSNLLPGQTVIIWLEPPGDVPLLNKLFTNDDSATGK